MIIWAEQRKYKGLCPLLNKYTQMEYGTTMNGTDNKDTKYTLTVKAESNRRLLV